MRKKLKEKKTNVMAANKHTKKSSGYYRQLCGLPDLHMYGKAKILGI